MTEPVHPSIISSISNQVRAPLPTKTSGNEFAMYFLVRKFNLCTPHEIRSKYFSFGGYLWRILIQPRGKEESFGLGAFFECGGPDVRLFPAGSSLHISPFWSVTARSNTVLLHPSKWRHIGITDEDLTSESELHLSGEIDASVFDKKDYPQQPLDLTSVSNYTFMAGQGCGYGKPGFSRFALLQPGLFADDNMNIVIVLRLVLDDGFNNNVPVEASDSDNGNEEENEDESDGKNKDEEQKTPFMEAFSRRSILMEKMVDWDKKLNSAKNQTVRSVLQKEIDYLTETLSKLPNLDSYV